MQKVDEFETGCVTRIILSLSLSFSLERCGRTAGRDEGPTGRRAVGKRPAAVIPLADWLGPALQHRSAASEAMRTRPTPVAEKNIDYMPSLNS